MPNVDRSQQRYCLALVQAITMDENLHQFFIEKLHAHIKRLRDEIGSQQLEQCSLYHRCVHSSILPSSDAYWDLSGENSFQKLMEDLLAQHNPDSLAFLKQHYSIG